MLLYEEAIYPLRMAVAAEPTFMEASILLARAEGRAKAQAIKGRKLDLCIA